MRQKLVILTALWAAAVLAASPEESLRKAMAVSVARQAASVTAMRLSLARQRSALRTVAPPGAETGARSDGFFTLEWPATGVCDPLPAAEISSMIQQAASQEGVDQALLQAVAEEESGLRPCAVSRKGAMGLMQLMPATVAELGVRDPFDPRENLFAGARFLRHLLTRFGGNAALALGAYNAGPATVEESSGVPAIPETQRYVREILSRLPPP